MHALCPALSPGVRVLLWCVWQLVAALVQWLQQAAGSGQSTHTLHRMSQQAKGRVRGAEEQRPSRADRGKRIPAHGFASHTLAPPRSSPPCTQPSRPLLHSGGSAACSSIHRPQCEEEGLPRLRPAAAAICERSEATEVGASADGAAVRFPCCCLSNQEWRAQCELPSVHHGCVSLLCLPSVCCRTRELQHFPPREAMDAGPQGRTLPGSVRLLQVHHLLQAAAQTCDGADRRGSTGD